MCVCYSQCLFSAMAQKNVIFTLCGTSHNPELVIPTSKISASQLKCLLNVSPTLL